MQSWIQSYRNSAKNYWQDVSFSMTFIRAIKNINAFREQKLESGDKIEKALQKNILYKESLCLRKTFKYYKRFF